MKRHLKKSIYNGIIVLAMIAVFLIMIGDVLFNGYEGGLLSTPVYFLFYVVAFTGIRL